MTLSLTIDQGSVYSGAVTGSYVGGMMYTSLGYTAVFMSATGLMIGEEKHKKFDKCQEDHYVKQPKNMFQNY